MALSIRHTDELENSEAPRGLKEVNDFAQLLFRLIAVAALIAATWGSWPAWKPAVVWFLHNLYMPKG